MAEFTRKVNSANSVCDRAKIKLFARLNKISIAHGIKSPLRRTNENIALCIYILYPQNTSCLWSERRILRVFLPCPGSFSLTHSCSPFQHLLSERRSLSDSKCWNGGDKWVKFFHTPASPRYLEATLTLARRIDVLRSSQFVFLWTVAKFCHNNPTRLNKFLQSYGKFKTFLHWFYNENGASYYRHNTYEKCTIQ